jgi:hypothetical protein
MAVGDDFSVSQRVANIVAVVLWVPVLVVLLGGAAALAITAVGAAYRYAWFGIAPPGASVSGAIDPTILAAAVLGGVGVLYLMLARATFGDEAVNETLETVEQYSDSVRGEDPDPDPDPDPDTDQPDGG